MMKENKDFGEKNSQYFALFRNFCSWIVIVGRLLLLYSPEYLEGLSFSATMPKTKNQNRRVYCFLWWLPPLILIFRYIYIGRITYLFR